MARTLNKLASLALVALTGLGLGGVARSETGVSISQREALVFAANATKGTAADQVLAFTVDLTVSVNAHRYLDSKYRAVTYVVGNQATRARLSNELDRITNLPGLKAVDLIFVAVNTDSRILFSDGPVSMTTIRNDILGKLTVPQRARLRMVYSADAFGSSHLARWRAVGFKVAAGSRGICADTIATIHTFLLNWAGGSNYSSAVGITNLNPAGLAAEAVIGGMFLAMFRPDLAAKVISDRDISGASGLRITTMP